MDNLFQTSLFCRCHSKSGCISARYAFKEKFKLAILNPLLISIVLTIIVLVVADVDYDTYNKGASYLSWFLTPATVCLAIPLYEQWTLLKKNYSSSRARTHGRRHNKPCDSACAVSAYGAFTRGLCHTASKVHHDSYRYGRIRGARRICDYHCRSYRRDRCAWKYTRRVCLQNIQNH